MRLQFRVAVAFVTMYKAKKYNFSYGDLILAKLVPCLRLHMTQTPHFYVICFSFKCHNILLQESTLSSNLVFLQEGKYSLPHQKCGEDLRPRINNRRAKLDTAACICILMERDLNFLSVFFLERPEPAMFLRLFYFQWLVLFSRRY